MTSNDYVGQFAGAGGWSIAAERLGLRGVEIENNPAACATLRAAGFETIEGSVTDLKVQDHWSVNTVPGLTASPPCQTFSAAGKGAGRADMDLILLALKRWAWDQDDFSDPRTALVLEPARWILERIGKGQPYEWIAMEQVPTCLPIWHAYAEMLDGLGYFTAVGILSSEMFGVPQTRKRAILLAHRQRPISLPTPTHSKYYPRNKTKLDPGVEKWVSMATALGWTEDTEVVSNYGTGGDASNRGRRTGDEPAASVTSKIDRNLVRLRSSFSDAGYRKAPDRSEDEPAATITGKHRSAVWLRSNYSAGSSHTGTAAERGRAERPLDDPAFTVGGKGGDQWVHDRPSITVNCDPRISKPRRHDPNDSGSQQKDSIRVTVQEAGILQSFPADHPWQGTKTEQYQQVGNACPPLLAYHVLRQVIDL